MKLGVYPLPIGRSEFWKALPQAKSQAKSHAESQGVSPLNHQTHWREIIEDFCEEEYGLKRAQAYALISASNVKDSIQMSAMADSVTHINQTRALAPIPAEKRVEVVEKAAAKGSVTAKAIHAEISCDT